jgi:hypothetical protein
LQKPTTRWHQSAFDQKAGCIIAAGLTKEVAFEAVEGRLTPTVFADAVWELAPGTVTALASQSANRLLAQPMSVLPAAGATLWAPKS